MTSCNANLLTFFDTALRKYPSSKLGDMFNGFSHPPKDKDGCFFIDKSGQYFDHILEFLRDGSYLPPIDKMTAVINEAQYFKLVKYAEKMQYIQQSAMKK
jgi:hypothetical protein